MHLPPLRNRKQDITPLVDHFLESALAQGLPEFRPSEEVMATMVAYDWPGNVRELKHCVDRMSALHSEGALQMADLPSALQYRQAADDLARLGGALGAEQSGRLPEVDIAPISPVISLPDSERHTIERALAAT